MPLPYHLQKAIHAILTTPAATEVSLRRAVLERTRLQEDHSQVPEILRELINKIAERPWTVSDEDFARLRDAGYSEGHIYEVTMAAALGSGLRRFDAGLRALKENS
jgi:alkylhydroperoxidase family enzyme